MLLSGFIVLDNPESPQSKASEWIINDDPLRLSTDDRPEIVQRYALATLYFATGNNWEKCASPIEEETPCDDIMTRFLSGAPSCRWMGIICDANSFIHAGKNGLVGTLPAELSELTRLSTLGLSRNSLYGTIPTHFVRLRKLRFLLLNHNKFEGTIPTLIGQLSSIWYLHLGSNQFKGTLPQQAFAPSMQDFDVSNNQLTGTIPSDINTISKDLLNLDISSNKLTGTIPSTIGQFSSLSTFAANNNTISGILPEGIVSRTLTTLDVGINAFTGTIPSSIYTLGSSLTFINLGLNKFDGTIPSQLGTLTSLETLVFFFNKLTGTIPSELSNLWNLQVLHFVGNSLGGTMPSGICQLREDVLISLTSDCEGDTPALECVCCTYCSSAR